MKLPRLRFIILALAVGVAQLSVPTVAVLAISGCQHAVTLEAGGAYTNPYLATTDQAILDANKVLTDFVAWHAANADFLDKYPQVGQLAASITQHRTEWIRSAYAARDAYKEADDAYRAGKAGAPSNANIAAALAVLNNIASQIASYKSLHP